MAWSLSWGMLLEKSGWKTHLVVIGPGGAVHELQELGRHSSLASWRRRSVEDIDDLLNGTFLRGGDGHVERRGSSWLVRLPDGQMETQRDRDGSDLCDFVGAAGRRPVFGLIWDATTQRETTEKASPTLTG